MDGLGEEGDLLAVRRGRNLADGEVELGGDRGGSGGELRRGLGIDCGSIGSLASERNGNCAGESVGRFG